MAQIKSKSNFHVDRVLATLPPEEVDSFLDFCWTSPPAKRIQSELKQLLDTYDVENSQTLPGLNAIYSWYKNKFPIGEEIKEFNKEMRIYTGVAHRSVPQKILYDLVLVQSKLKTLVTNVLETVEVGEVDNETFSKLVQVLPVFTREIRALSSQVDNYTVKENIHQERMDAAQMAIAAIIQTFKDSPLEDNIKDAALDAIQRVEAWSRDSK